MENTRKWAKGLVGVVVGLENVNEGSKCGKEVIDE